MIGNLATKCLFLRVVEPGGTLNVGQCFFRSIPEPLINLTTDQRPFELPDKLLQMVFYHPVKVHQFAVNIVDDLDSAWFFEKIYSERDGLRSLQGYELQRL